MSINDFQIIESKGAITETFDVQDRTNSGLTVTIKPGEALMQSGNYVVPVTDGKPVIGTDEFIGFAQTESTEDATDDGTVEVTLPVFSKTVIRGRATTATNINTEAKLLLYKQNCVALDVSSLKQTVDENQATDPNTLSMKIIGGDIDKGTLDFVVQQKVGYASGTVGQTRDA